MRLISIQLKNYRQYTSFSREFCGNLIGVIGHNGAGKSHLLEAIHFALAGEIPGSIKAKLLKWSTGIGFVKLTFEHLGTTYLVNRNLHDETATLVTTNSSGLNAVDIKGITKVTAKIMELLDIDKDVLRQSAFVRQAEIDTVLFTEPKIREMGFQKLCGVANAHKVHKKLGEYLTQIPLQYNYEDQVVEAKLQLKELRERFESVGSEIISLSECRMVSFGGLDSKSLQSKYDTLVHRLHALDNHGLLSRELDSVDANMTKLKAELCDIDVKIKDVDTALIQNEVVRLKGALNSLEKYTEAAKDLKTVEDMLSSLSPPCSIEELKAKEEQQVKMTESHITKKSEHASQASLFEALDSMAANMTECPVCHSHITDPAKIKAEIAQKATSLQLEITCVSSLLLSLTKDIRDLSSKFEQYRLSMSSYSARRDVLRKTVADLSDNAGKNRKAICEELAAILELQSMVSSMTTQKNRLAGQISELESRHKDLSTSIQKLKTEIDVTSREIVLGQISDVKEKLDSYNAIDIKIGELTGTKNEVNNSMQTLEKSIGQLESKIASADVHRQTLTTLNNVREWFHYSNGPHHIASLYLAQLTKDTNKFLDKFSAKFIVTPDPVNLGFNIIYTDGRPMPLSGVAPAEDLSGGEKVSLALSFRFANYCLFASKLGLLSLDEPTVFLDKDNVVNFCSLMETIKTIISNMGIQIIISTHEENVIPYLDDVINLNTIGETK